MQHKIPTLLTAGLMMLGCIALNAREVERFNDDWKFSPTAPAASSVSTILTSGTKDAPGFPAFSFLTIIVIFVSHINYPVVTKREYEL